MNYEPYQKRLLIEMWELSDRLDKLRAFTHTTTFSALPPQMQNCMMQQRDAMQQYVACLSWRVDDFLETAIKDVEELPAMPPSPGWFILNGTTRPIPHKHYTLSYDAICRLAGILPFSNPSIMWSIKKGDAGILPHEANVVVTDGMVITCMITGNA